MDLFAFNTACAAGNEARGENHEEESRSYDQRVHCESPYRASVHPVDSLSIAPFFAADKAAKVAVRRTKVEGGDPT